MKFKTLLTIFLFLAIPVIAEAQTFSNLVVSYDQCAPGTTWSGWRSNVKPYFSFNFNYPYTTVEITVRATDGGTYNQVRNFSGPGSCFTWPDNLPSGTYDWIVRVYYQFNPSTWLWSPMVAGSVFRVDATPPTTPVVTEHNCGGSSSPNPPWVTGVNPRFTWSTPSDAHSGFNRVEVSFNLGITWNTVTSGWNPTAEGSITYFFRSVDNVGNVSPNTPIYVRIDKTAPPNPGITESHCGPQGQWTAHTSPYFAWPPVIDAGYPLNGSGVNRYEVSVNSGSWQTVSSVWHPEFGTGQYSFVFRAVDNVGLASTGSPYVIYIDNTRPNQPLVTEHNCNGSSTPDPQWSNHGSPRFTWDNPGDIGSGIASTGFSASINEGPWQTVQSGWNPTTGEGSHKIWFRSTDRVGHISDTTTVYIRIDLTPPVANAGADIITDKYEEVSFNGSLSSDNIGIESYTWTFDDGSGNIVLSGVSPVHTFNTAGNFVVTLTVKDYAGNEHNDNLIVTVNTPTGAELQKWQELKVYPIPTDGVITIELPAETAGSSHLTYLVVSHSGRTAVSGGLTGNADQIDLSVAGSGVYTLIIRSEGKVMATRRVVIR